MVRVNLQNNVEEIGFPKKISNVLNKKLYDLIVLNKKRLICFSKKSLGQIAPPPPSLKQRLLVNSVLTEVVRLKNVLDASCASSKEDHW